MSLMDTLKPELEAFAEKLTAAVREAEQGLQAQNRELEQRIRKLKILEEKEQRLKELEACLARERGLIEKEKTVDQERKLVIELKEKQLKEKADRLQQLLAT